MYMKLDDLKHANEAALIEVETFREISSLSLSRPHTTTFHQFKNEYPFLGFIEVEIDGCHPFLMYSNNDDLIAMTYFWHGPNSYERKSIQEWVARTESRQHILDVGAFSGLYALSAACSKKRAKDARIYAFEPTRRVYSRLLANVQANKLGSIISLEDYAVSDAIGLVNFYQYRGENVLGNGASFIDKGIPHTSSGEIVQAVTLDWFLTSQNISVDLIKIDVEQAEVLALEGMRETLAQCKPDILIEVAKDTAEGVFTLLKEHGYRVYTIDEEKQDLLPFENSRCDKVVNLLAEQAL